MRARLAGAALAGLLAAATGAAWVGAAAAQPAPSPADELAITDTDTSAYPVVRVTVSAPRALLGEVPPGAFTLAEDGAERPVRVERLPDEALQVVLLIDSSGSMAGEALDAAKASAASFVERMPEGAQIAVLPFSSAPGGGGFTTDHAAAIGALAALEAGGRSALYDAAGAALDAFAGLPRGRRVVVLLSDGEDNASTATLEQVTGRLAAGGVALQAIELQTQFSDRAALDALAAAGRGEVVSISDPAGLAQVYERIAVRLLDQYLLEYRSQAAGSARIAVTVVTAEETARAEATVALPGAAPGATAEPSPPAPTVEVLGVDDTAYPFVEVTVAAPPELAGAGEFALLEDGLAVNLTVREAPGGRYVLTYRSSGREDTELEVVLRGEGWEARAERAATLPPLPWLRRFLTGPWALRAGALALYVALAVVVLLLLAPRRVRTTLDDSAPGVGRRRRGGGLAAVGDWAEDRIERTLTRRGLGPSLNRRLEQAGILLKPSEYVVVTVAAALVALALGVLVAGPLLGVALAAVVLLGGRSYLGYRIAKRRAAFTGQLGDTLQLLSGSLRAGYALLQAVDAVAKEADSPTAEEFRRVVVETRLGRDIGEALEALGERIASDDLDWVVQAIEIHRDVGGDLAEVLDRVGETIRDRDHIARQVKSLSAEGRLSAKVLIGLPFVVMAGLSLINPGYLSELTGTGTGRLLLVIAAAMMTAGAVWIQRLVKIEF